jgi:hypothetical protein
MTGDSCIEDDNLLLSVSSRVQASENNKPSSIIHDIIDALETSHKSV